MTGKADGYIKSYRQIKKPPAQFASGACFVKKGENCDIIIVSICVSLSTEKRQGVELWV